MTMTMFVWIVVAAVATIQIAAGVLLLLRVRSDRLAARSGGTAPPSGLSIAAIIGGSAIAAPFVVGALLTTMYRAEVSPPPSPPPPPPPSAAELQAILDEL